MLKSKQSQETRTVGHPTLTSLSTSLSPFSTFSMWKMEDHKKKKKNLLFNLLQATPEAYGSSQARGRIGAAAAGYTTATATQDLSLICDLHHSSWQCCILIPLSEARDRTHILVVPSRIHFHCATTGTPHLDILWRIGSSIPCH